MGVVLFEMVTGRLPFESENEYELLRMHIQASRPSVRSIFKDVPGAVADVIERAMDRKAGRRFRSADEMADGLQKCLDAGQRRTPTTGLFQRIFGVDAEPLRVTPAPAVTERRRTDVSSTCHRVEDLIEQQLFGEASSVLNAGFRSFPDEPEFIDLRNRLLRQQQQYEQAVAQQTDLVRDLLRRGFSEEALKVAGNALGMYPRATNLIDLQRECRRRVDLANVAAGELAQVESRVDEFIAAGQFQEGTDHVLGLLGAHEGQIELNKLLARILQARKLAEKQAAIEQCMRGADEAADAGKWEPALAILEDGLVRFPGEARLQDLSQALNARFQAELRRLAVEAAITEARDLEISTSLRAARERLTKDFERLGRDETLARELERIDAAIEAARRDASIGSAVSAAAELQGKQKWEDSLALLDQTAAREGRDTRIDELRATVAAELRAHEAQVARAASEARQRLQDLQWEEAILRLSTATRELPGERVLNDLMQEAQRGLAQKRREETIARIKLEAGQRARSLDYAEALRVLLDGLCQYPADEDLSAALSQTVFERDTYLAGEKVKAARKQVSVLRGEANFEAAIEVLRETLRELPGNPDLQGAVSELEGEWREIRRRKTIQEVTGAVEASILAEDYQPALAKLALGLAEWPAEPELQELERRTRASQRLVEKRKALSNTLAKGRVLETEERWVAAAQLYERTLAEFPETASELGSLIAGAHARDLESRRKARIAELTHNIGEWIEAGRLEEADRELQRADREFPGEAGFATWREELAEKRRRIARESAIRKAMDGARSLLERQAFEEAQSILRTAEQEHGPDAALRELLNSVEVATRERLAAIELGFARIQALVEKRDFESAISAVLRGAEQFPNVPRFRELLGELRQSRETERKAKEFDRRISQIDALLGENAFDDAEVLIRNALRDYAGDAAVEERKGRLEEARRLEGLEAAFRETAGKVRRLSRQRQWAQARQLLAPYLDGGRTQAAAEAVLAELARQEGPYLVRTRELEEQARALINARRYADALALLEPAAAEFPEIAAFSNLLADVREGAALEREGRMGEAKHAIRSLMAGQTYEEALREVDRALGEYPGEKAFRDLRALIVAANEEKAAVAAVGAEVQRLVAAGKGTEADRVLLEGLRRYPGRAELTSLRAAVDAVRKAEWERQSRDAGLKRATLGVERLLGGGELAEAGMALAALEKEYGDGAAAALTQRLAAALAERERVAEENRQREAAERESERQRLEAEERNLQLEEERRAQTLEAAFSQTVGDVGRLRRLRQWEQARQLVVPYVNHATTHLAAEALLAELARQEGPYLVRTRELEERARALIKARQYADALALLEPASTEFPEIAVFSKMLIEVREGAASERKDGRLGEAKQAIRSLMASQRFEEALREVDRVLGDYPGEKAFVDLRTLIVANAAVAAVGAEVRRLVAEAKGAEADRTLVEALRRYPGRTELTSLRPAVDAVRKAEWEQQAREAEIEKLIGAGKLAEADAALAALEKMYGKTAPELAQRLTAALADRERIAEANRQREAAEREREAERQRLEAESRQTWQANRQFAGGTSARPSLPTRQAVNPTPITQPPVPSTQGIPFSPWQAGSPRFWQRRTWQVAAAVCVVAVVSVVLVLLVRSWSSTPLADLRVSPAKIDWTFPGKSNAPVASRVEVEGGQFAFKAMSRNQWIAVEPGEGVAPASITVKLTEGTLGPGPYDGEVRVWASALPYRAKTIPVHLQIEAATNSLSASPKALFLSYKAYSADYPAGQVNVISTAGPLRFSVRVTKGSEWLTVRPSAEVTPAHLSVGYHNPAGAALTVGNHDGEILCESEGSQFLIAVILTIEPTKF